MNTKNAFISVIFILLSCFACQAPTPFDVEAAKTEIFQTESDFADLAAKEGLKKAFLAYAADDAVLMRNDKLIKGKPAMAAYFDQSTLQDVQLQWTPDTVVVAASCDLGYTYGKYTFSARDTAGKKIEAEGVFHTVWKKEDGEWKFVWD